LDPLSSLGLWGCKALRLIGIGMQSAMLKWL